MVGSYRVLDCITFVFYLFAFSVKIVSKRLVYWKLSQINWIKTLNSPRVQSTSPHIQHPKEIENRIEIYVHLLFEIRFKAWIVESRRKKKILLYMTEIAIWPPHYLIHQWYINSCVSFPFPTERNGNIIMFSQVKTAGSGWRYSQTGWKLTF